MIAFALLFVFSGCSARAGALALCHRTLAACSQAPDQVAERTATRLPYHYVKLTLCLNVVSEVAYTRQSANESLTCKLFFSWGRLPDIVCTTLAKGASLVTGQCRVRVNRFEGTTKTRVARVIDAAGQ